MVSQRRPRMETGPPDDNLQAKAGEIASHASQEEFIASEPSADSSEPEQAVKATLSERLNAPVSAFVVDLFRVACGLMIVVYFGRLFLEFSDFTSQSGFLDHSLHRELFWFTKLSLIYPESPDWFRLAVLGLGALGAVMLTVGWQPKVGAVLAWVVAVSIHRWNFAVINVDDSSITLLLWWMLFLPIGRCLTYRTWRHGWRSEVGIRAEGFFVRAFFANLFIYYLTVGLTKTVSSLWSEGLALYVVLKLPLARTNSFWTIDHIPFLWFGNHFTLIFEPLFPFIIFLRKGHPIKYAVAGLWVAFHLAIPLSIGVPYANFTLILALILVFHRELDDRFCGNSGAVTPVGSQAETVAGGGRLAKRLIGVYLIVLALAMTKKVPVVGAVYEPAMATLYWGGIAQEYHLFDWIDRFNWYLDNKVSVRPTGSEEFTVDSARLFPATVRGFIVQSYLLPMRWMRVPRPLTGEMRNSIIEKSVARFLARERESLVGEGRVVVTSKVGRINQENLDLSRIWSIVLVEFTYRDGELVELIVPEIPRGLEASLHE